MRLTASQQGWQDGYDAYVAVRRGEGLDVRYPTDHSAYSEGFEQGWQAAAEHYQQEGRTR